MRRAAMSMVSIQARTRGTRTGSEPGGWSVSSTESRGAASSRRVRPSGAVANSTSTTVPAGVLGEAAS